MTLITKEGWCPGCMMTKKVLDAAGVKYTIKHITNDLKTKNHVKDLGFRSYPIVEPHDSLDGAFAGFQPAKLHAIAKEQATE